MADKEVNIHEGHRQRMREKLVLHGSEVFATYELLEMLLYYSVPYKDTNPISKGLLNRFGGLYGVFNASREELCSVDGIGEKTADLIIGAGAYISRLLDGEKGNENPVFDDYRETGYFLLERFNQEERGTRSVYVMLFDTSMRLLKLEKVIEGYDYGSARVRVDDFLRPAMDSNAAAVIVAHNHPYGPLFPTEADTATNMLVADALSGVGIALVEHYIISGNSFMGMMNNLESAFRQKPEIARFIQSKRRGYE